MPRGRVWFVTGTPGAGKSTLAKRLSERYDRPLIVTGDIARQIDPDALARGDWADPEKFMVAFKNAVYALAPDGVKAEYIVDGYPRSLAQFGEIADLLVGDDPEAYVFYLCCVPTDVAVERLTRRGRKDDTPELIRARLDRQVADFESWVRKALPWGQSINTRNRTADYVEETFRRFLDGERREVF